MSSWYLFSYQILSSVVNLRRIQFSERQKQFFQSTKRVRNTQISHRQMSNYEEEHNISEERNSAQTQDNNTHRTHQTLSNLLGQFFEESSSTNDTPQGLPTEATQIDEFTRAIRSLGDIPLRDALIEQLSTEKDIEGVAQEYIDSLERVSKKSLKRDQTCSICTNDFLDDPHPLVVRLPCAGNHKFDLECIAPWLKIHSTCPLCRKNLLEKKKFVDLPEDDEEEEDDWEMYG